VSTFAEIVSPVMVCGWFLIAAARTLTTSQTAEEEQ
jgi:hypothetical protein